MNTSTPNSDDVLFQINLLIDKLKRTTDEGERRILLKQFRAMLETVDAMTNDDDLLHI